MSEPRRKPSRRVAKCALAIFGVLLGGGIAVLVLQLPDSAPWSRVQALWQPAFRDLRRGSAALKKHEPGTAAAWFSHAIASSENGSNAQTVLDLAVDECGRHQAWDLAIQYAGLSLQRRHFPVDELRYGEALAGARRPSVAEFWLQKALKDSAGNIADDQSLLVHEMAERDLSVLLADHSDSASDLNQARLLAEDGIASEMKRGGSPEDMASMNDALGWVYYKEGLVARNSGDLEMARIYGENGAEDLTPSTDPSVAATVYYHLSEIYGATGRKSEAAATYKTAMKLSEKTVRWQIAEASQTGPAKRLVHNAAQNG
ncbi:MAG TPA: hypothetical protein VFJ58_01110 [Armatimonadota bacterium]|nr:hypothetical protein [Armatimonadota bacterium]